MKVPKSKIAANHTNKYGHKKCLCYINNYFGATSFDINMPKQTVSNPHVGLYGK